MKVPTLVNLVGLVAYASGASYSPLLRYKWNTTITDGYRTLIDSGTSPRYNADLYFGSGVKFNGIDQRVNSINCVIGDIGYIFMEVRAINGVYFLSQAGASRLYIKASAHIGLGDSANIPTGRQTDLDDGNHHTILTMWDNGNWTQIIDNTEVLKGTYEGAVNVEAISLGGSSAYDNYNEFIAKNTQIGSFIPTQTQIEYQYNNPEKFLYREDDILKSEILPQTEIDNVVAYLPMCETDGFVRDLVSYSEGVEINDENAEWWFVGSNWSYADNVLESLGDNTDARAQIDNPTLFAGKFYTLSFDVLTHDGVLNIYIIDGGFNRLDMIQAAGSYAYTVFIANDESYFSFYSNPFTGTIANISIREVTGTYPIASYTDEARTDATQLRSGLQSCFLKRDAAGVPYAGNFDSVKFDEVGKIDTNYIVDSTNSYHVEFIINRKDIYLYETFGTNRDLFRLYETSMTVKVRDQTTSGASIPSTGAFHIYSQYISTGIDTGEHKLWVNGVLKNTTAIDKSSYSGGEWYFPSSLISEFRMFNVHIEVQDPTKLYNTALAKGLLD